MSFLSCMRRAVCAGAFLLGLSALPAHSATYIVSSTDDSGVGSLRQALASANANPDADTITIKSGLKGTLTLTSGELPITSRVTIQGPGSGTLTLSGNNANRLFNVSNSDAQVTVSGLTLTAGKQTGVKGASGVSIRQRGSQGGDAQGGAVYNAGTLSLTDVLFTDNSVVGGVGGSGGPGDPNGGGGRGSAPGPGGTGGGGQGGAIYNAGTLTLANTRLQNNGATGGQGGQGYLGGTGGAAQGGAIYNAGQLNQSEVTFSNNSAVAGTGGSYRGAVGVAQENDIFTNDVAPIANDATFTILQGRPFRGQLVAQGVGLTYALVSGTLPSGLSLDAKTGIISGAPTTPVSGAQATYQVSNKRNSSNGATVTFNIITSQPQSYIVTTSSDASTDGDGLTSLREAIGAANAYSSATGGVGLSNISFSLPTGTPQTIMLTQGRITFSADATIVWRGSIPLTVVGENGSFFIEGGTATLSGFKITGSKTVTAIQVRGTLNLSNCTISNNTGYYGGGFYSYGTLNLSNCTVGNNTAENGAGIYSSGTLSLSNCTVCGNTAQYGGGIYSSSGTLLVDSCTVTGNRSTTSTSTTSDGGIVDGLGTAQVTNSILVGNSPKDYSGPSTNSIVGGTYEAVGLDPRGLQDNGGPTQTIALLAGSPALDAGQTSLKTDQRGVARPQGSAPDIGAFESASPLLPTLSVKDITLKEGNSGTTRATFTVTLSAPSTRTVTVKYATQNASKNSAAAGYDYIAASGILSFAPGEKSKTVTVQIKGDTLVEPSESFVLKLTAPVNAIISDATALCTIQNDDAPPKSPASNGSAPTS